MHISTKLNIESFIRLSENHLILDVRSPAEYNQAHIPGAVNLPLFSNEERAIVGANYKQKSREEAIKIGLDFFGPKMRSMVETVEKIIEKENLPREIFIHCWRGGMRSEAVAWLLNLYGFKVNLLEGGYKSFRNYVLKQFQFDYDIEVIGGYTGTRKTSLLNQLKNEGQTIIDLEKIANHRGSAFGKIGDQPSQEMFENLLAVELYSNKTNKIFFEDESQRIGDRIIPNDFWEKFRQKKLWFFNLPFEQRLENILVDYGTLNNEYIVEGIDRIKKRLGPLETKNALEAIKQNDRKSCFEILLKYYDKQYEKSLHQRNELSTDIQRISINEINDAVKFFNHQKMKCGK